MDISTLNAPANLYSVCTKPLGEHFSFIQPRVIDFLI